MNTFCLLSDQVSFFFRFVGFGKVEYPHPVGHVPDGGPRARVRRAHVQVVETELGVPAGVAHLYSTVQYSTVQYSTVQYSTVYSTV